jgi:truncated hemoglobin YjbI
VRHVHLGEKIGTETAQIWLEAMREEGVLREVVKNGKRAYELIA